MKFYIVYCVETRKILHYCNSQDDALQFILESKKPNLRWRVGEYGDLHPDRSEGNWCFRLFMKDMIEKIKRFRALKVAYQEDQFTERGGSHD